MTDKPELPRKLTSRIWQRLTAIAVQIAIGHLLFDEIYSGRLDDLDSDNGISGCASREGNGKIDTHNTDRLNSNAVYVSPVAG